MQTNILCHIIGFDEIHKKKFISKFSEKFNIIDLDTIQQKIYNEKEITKCKLAWSQISQDIIIKKKQKTIGSKVINTMRIDKQIKKLMDARNNVKKKIHLLWKNKMIVYIKNAISVANEKQIIIVGFNIFPKDYRLKINIDISSITSTNLYNKIIFSTSANTYAANQIKFYLNAYQDKIVKGTFPMNLLNLNYMTSKYEKFTAYYEKNNYYPLDKNEMITTIAQLYKYSKNIKNIDKKIVYVITTYKVGDFIPIDSKKPIEGFMTKNEAINNHLLKIKKNTPVYIYQIYGNQFEIIDNKIIANKPLYPIDDEYYLITIHNDKL